jgi:serine phosphatase RsbU (regulator of sigma subunit)
VTKVNLSLDIGISSMAKKNEELCGDVVEIKKGPDSTVVVLSDGLGSGVKASILASLTAKIASNLLVRGVEMPQVVETIVETLPVCKVRQIAYSTFTIVQLFEQGLTYITQYDNPPVLYIKKGTVSTIEGKEKTVAGRLVSDSKRELEEGDVLVLVSDGVTHAGIGALLPLGLGVEGLTHLIENDINLKLNAHEIAEQIIQYCQAYSASEPGDDITVVDLYRRQLNYCFRRGN